MLRKNYVGKKVEFSNEVMTPEEATIGSDFNTLCRSETAESLTKESHRNRRTGWCHRHGFVVSQQICQPRWSIVPKRYRDAPSHVAEYTEMMSEEEFEAMMKIDLTDL